MRTILFAAAIALVSAATSVSANPTIFIESDPNIFVNNPVIEGLEEMACFGCISPETGRPRTNYVRPHVRRNGTPVPGYWRS